MRDPSSTTKRVTLSLDRIKLNRQGYTSAGRYYGVGKPLFQAFVTDADSDRSYDQAHDLVNRPSLGGNEIRADSRQAAKAEFAARLAKARLLSQVQELKRGN
jgi:hypothetical protein